MPVLPHWKSIASTSFLLALCFSLLPAQSKLNQLIGVASLEEKPAFVNQRPTSTDFPGFKIECPNGNREMLHMTDLDNDGDQDLIFNGSCSPYNRVIIYLNEEGDFAKIWEGAGKIFGIEKGDQGSEVLVWNAACCCNYYNSVQLVSIQQSQPIPEVESLSWHEKIKVPADSYSKSQSGIGLFRNSPLLNDEPQEDPCSGETVLGNQNFIVKMKTAAFEIANQDDMQLVAIKVSAFSWKLGWQEINKGN